MPPDSAPLSRAPRGPYAKSEARRDVIVQAAIGVFAEWGYRGATVRRIADAAGLSPSSIAHYYPTKRELLEATMRYRDERRFDLGKRRHVPYPQRVIAEALANEDVPQLVQLYSVLTAESATAGHPASRYFAARFARLRSEYEREFTVLAEAGLLRRGIAPGAAARMLIALWDGIQLQWLHAPEDVRAADALRDFFELVLEVTPA